MALFRRTVHQIALVIVSSIVAGEAFGQTPIEVLLRTCDQKTEVWGRNEQGQVVKTGEHLGDFCDGYLQGFFAAQVRSRAICPSTDERVSSELLLSIVQTYHLDTSNKKKADSSHVLDGALKRTFGCPN